ncbi:MULTISPECIES: hypothetical protein [unclassified Streptomyces]|uniref:hypothetical protein n=1 Tax=unclassified Streptomyces TaxID=2593676 RepID=UPI00224EB678|nr:MULTISPECIES: hypothetical protein [unclassified Streptomyces]MCX5052222.1 hypothetical protein [Streptomyces sp. NBC_00474]
MDVAEALGRVDVEWGARLLETLATDPTIDGYVRKRAAEVKMAVERAARVPETRATELILNDPTLSVSDRVAEAEALARVDVERGVRLLEALATDPTLDVGSRGEAASALARVDPVRGHPLVIEITLEIAGGYY